MVVQLTLRHLWTSLLRDLAILNLGRVLLSCSNYTILMELGIEFEISSDSSTSWSWRQCPRSWERPWMMRNWMRWSITSTYWRRLIEPIKYLLMSSMKSSQHPGNIDRIHIHHISGLLLSIFIDEANPLDRILVIPLLSLCYWLSNYINIFFSYIALNNAIPDDNNPHAICYHYQILATKTGSKYWYPAIFRDFVSMKNRNIDNNKSIISNLRFLINLSKDRHNFYEVSYEFVFPIFYINCLDLLHYII